MLNKPMSSQEKKVMSSLVRPKGENKVLDKSKVGDKSPKTLPIRGFTNAR
jgi:hypothetical protein